MDPWQPTTTSTGVEEHDRRPFRFQPAAAPPPAERKLGLHVFLFFATFLTTSLASALNQGHDVFSDPATIRHGFAFGVTVMTILLCHESGHYLLARWHRVDATLPFFLPAPPFFLIGTFGAFIRMRSLPRTRQALFDIGAAGPWAGFLIAVPAVVVGLQLSEVRTLDPWEGGLVLGDSLLFSWLTQLVLGVSADEATILLHPVALAGWFGLLVTCLNLLPVGQLDGGHVVYAVFGRYHRWISRGVLAFLTVLGFTAWPGWLVWMVLLLFLGLDHPPTWDPATPLDRRRLVGAALTLVMLILTFMPVPIDIVEPSPPPVFPGQKIPVRVPERREIPRRASTAEPWMERGDSMAPGAVLAETGSRASSVPGARGWREGVAPPDGARARGCSASFEQGGKAAEFARFRRRFSCRGNPRGGKV